MPEEIALLMMKLLVIRDLSHRIMMMCRRLCDLVLPMLTSTLPLWLRDLPSAPLARRGRSRVFGILREFPQWEPAGSSEAQGGAVAGRVPSYLAGERANRQAVCNVATGGSGARPCCRATCRRFALFFPSFADPIDPISLIRRLSL